MIISDSAVSNRTTVFVLTLVIIMAGIFCYTHLPLESTPDVQVPNVFVTTVYRGVSPEDIEKNITIEIEKKLKGLEGIKEIKSQSLEGMSFINIEFVTGTDIDDALIKVKDKVDLAKPELPTDLEEDPSVTEMNFSEMPILVISLSGDCGLRRLTKIAEDLEEDIEGIKGVLEVDVTGKVEREIQIQIDPQRMALYGVPFTQLQAVVNNENQNVSGGKIRTSEGSYQLRVPSEFKDIKEIESIVIATQNESPVYLRDIAKVVDGIKDQESYARTNGKDAVTLYIKKRTGENIVQIIDSVNELLESSQANWPPGTELTRVSDRSKEIRDMLSDLENNIITGLLLVVIIVCFAMGLRNAFLVSLSIPLSMLITFVVLKMLGITLNMVVLFSLTLALGMLVDNAIVIIENIYRFMQQGVPRLEAAMRATSEVAWPITGSALTTIVAFVPLLWWSGIMGGFMVFLPRTVIISLASCLFVALIINPALAAVFMKVESNGKSTTADEVMKGGEHPMLSGGGRILSTYRWLLRGALKFRLAVVATGFVTLIAMGMIWFIVIGAEKGAELFPAVDPERAWIQMKMPEGADLEYADTIVREVACRLCDERAGSKEEKSGELKRLPYKECVKMRTEKAARTNREYPTPSFLPDVKYMYEKTSVGSSASFFGGSADNEVGIQFADLADRKHKSAETVGRIEPLMNDIPGAEITVKEAEEGPPVGAPINIEISGDDFKILGELSEKIKAVVSKVPNTRNVSSDFEQGSPTFHINVDRKRAALLGLSSSSIGFAVKSAINGTEVSSFREDDDDYDITVRFLEKDRRNLSTLRKTFIPSATSGLIPLTTVAKIEYTGGVGSITRIDYKRVVTVSAEVDETKTTGITARLKAEELLKDFTLPTGYNIKFTGENEFQKESEDFLGWAMGVALILIMFVLVAQFDSVWYPLIIMSAVILSFGGVFLGLAIFRMPFGIIMTGVGVISLAGVVVNNGIVLVDYTRLLLKRGLSHNDAIVAAGATRMRPVVLTAITTILGLIPMVTGVSYDFHNLQIQWTSESSQWWGAMAVAVIFGLGLATLLTLFVVPALISLSATLRTILVWLPKRLIWEWWRIFDNEHGTSYAAKWDAPYREIAHRIHSD